jgi:hypothetical protein
VDSPFVQRGDNRMGSTTSNPIGCARPHQGPPTKSRLARRFAFGRFADIRRNGPGLPPQGTNVASGLFQPCRIAADEDHVGAGIGGRERHLPPQPATAAGDEETLSSQSESVEDALRFTTLCYTSMWVSLLNRHGIAARMREKAWGSQVGGFQTSPSSHTV